MGGINQMWTDYKKWLKNGKKQIWKISSKIWEHYDITVFFLRHG